MIVWINNPFDHLPNEGRRLQRYGLLCQTLVREGHTVIWWSSDFSHAMKKKRPLPAIYTAPEGYEVRLIPTHPYFDNIGFRRIWSHKCYAHTWQVMAKKAVEEGELAPPTLVLTSWPPMETAKVARRFRQWWHCKVVVDIMDAWPQNFYRLIPGPDIVKSVVGGILFASTKRAWRKAMRASDAVSGVGRTYLNLAAQEGCRVPRHLCYHGIMRMNNGSRRFAIDVNEPLRLLYIGNMGRSYDLLTVIRGVKRLLNAKVPVRLDIAGSGPREKALRKEAHGYENIRFYGYLSNENMQQLLADSDIALIPMFADSFVAVPYKLADYTAAALPIICSLTGETQQLIERYGAGTMYQAGNVDSFIDAVKGYTVKRSRITQESLASARIARENFMMDRIYPEYVRFLTGI